MTLRPLWRRVDVLVLLVAAVMMLATVTAHASTSWWRPAVGLSWQWQLSGTVDTTVSAAVFDVDGQETSATAVAALHAQGRHVIGYVDLAWESYRPDAGSFPASVLGRTVAGWPAERYVDVRQAGVLLPIMRSRFAAIRAKGFDAVELDNDDSYVQRTGFPLTLAEQVAYDSALIQAAHADGLAVFAKNGISGDAFVRDMAALADGEVDEECHAYAECGELAPFVAAGKPVLNAEYTDDGTTLEDMCPVDQGFSSILKRVTLGRWRQVCP